METWAFVGVGALAVITLAGFFKTKTGGFGRFTVATLLLVCAFYTAALLLVAGKIEATAFGNILFAIVGYAGGLLSAQGSN
jgi:hypothetical protein